MTLEQLPDPFLGRLVLEIIKEDTEEYLRKTLHMEQSVLALPEMLTENKHVPYTKGIILKMAPDSFGERYKKNYGNDGTIPEIGDIVWFVNNQSFKIDPAGMYHIISDEHVIALNKAKVNKDV